MVEENAVGQSTDTVNAQHACTKMSSLPDGFDSTQRLFSVISVITRDLVAADLKWSLFVAASQSYKHDSCLRPFPPMFLVDGDKDLTALAAAVESVPSFLQLESLAQTLPQVAVALLHWVLIELKEPILSVVGKAEMGSVVRLVPCELSAPSPSLVLRLSYDPSSPAELRWAKAKRKYGSVYSFHGSKVTNFHSILHYGLQQHLTKNALFGQGVYLSSELLVCLPYSRNGFGWSHSCLGEELSVVALCEVISHPSVVCQAKELTVEEVPHKFYVVPNSELVRVRHLLVYAAQYTPLTSQGLSQCDAGLVGWMSRHKMAVSLFAYAVMLASVGLSRSPTWLRYWRVLCQTLGFRY